MIGQIQVEHNQMSTWGAAEDFPSTKNWFQELRRQNYANSKIHLNSLVSDWRIKINESVQSYLAKERPSDSVSHFDLWASVSPALSLPSGNLDCWLLFKDFLFRYVKCTLLYLYHWIDRTISIQSINIRTAPALPLKKKKRCFHWGRISQSQRQWKRDSQLSGYWNNNSKQRLCNVLEVSLNCHRDGRKFRCITHRFTDLPPQRPAPARRATLIFISAGLARISQMRKAGGNNWSRNFFC